MRIEYWRSAFSHVKVIIKAEALGRRLAEADIRYVPRTAGRATGANWKLILYHGY